MESGGQRQGPGYDYWYRNGRECDRGLFLLFLILPCYVWIMYITLSMRVTWGSPVLPLLLHQVLSGNFLPCQAATLLCWTAGSSRGGGKGAHLRWTSSQTVQSACASTRDRHWHRAGPHAQTRCGGRAIWRRADRRGVRDRLWVWNSRSNRLLRSLSCLGKRIVARVKVFSLLQSVCMTVSQPSTFSLPGYLP